jgi:kynureninase
VLPLRRSPPQDRDVGLEFPTNIYVFGGFRRYGAEIVLVEAEDGIRTDLQRLLDAIDERTLLVPLSLVLFRSSFIQDARAVIDKAHQVGAHVILDIYQAAGVIPIDLTALGADFAVRRIGQMAVRWPGAGYLYVRPDLGAPSNRPSSAGPRTPTPFHSKPRPSDMPIRPSASRAARPTCPALYCGARRLRDSRRHRRRRDPREVARPDAPPDRARLAAGYRVNTPTQTPSGQAR